MTFIILKALFFISIGANILIIPYNFKIKAINIFVNIFAVCSIAFGIFTIFSLLHPLAINSRENPIVTCLFGISSIFSIASIVTEVLSRIKEQNKKKQELLTKLVKLLNKKLLDK
jgi:hypothetical protein